MVPMHARKRKEVFDQPQRRPGILPACVGNADGTEPLALARSPGRLEACPTSGPIQFTIPIRGAKR